jgi:hypothetical protein
MTPDHPMYEVMQTLTTDEKFELMTSLSAVEVFDVNEKLLAPSVIQLKQLKILEAQYKYQHKILERGMCYAVAEQLDDHIARTAKASGAIEILGYLIALGNIQTQQTNEEGVQL